MRKLPIPLLGQLIPALLLMALLPMGISWFQLKQQAEVIAGQAQDFHHFATRTTARRAQTFVQFFNGVTRSLAENPAVESGQRSAALGEALTGTVASLEGVLAAGVYDPEGETVALAQRRDLSAELDSVFGALPGEDQAFYPELLTAADGQKLLRLRRPLADDRGFVLVIAEAADLEQILAAKDMGGSFEMLLVDVDRQVVAGGQADDLRRFPEEMFATGLDYAGSWSRIYRSPDGDGEIVAGRASLEGGPWLVISRQSAAEAEAAKDRLRRVQWLALLLALALTSIFSAFAYTTVIGPLRRLVAAQRELTGADPAGVGASEVAQLEASFRLLQERVQDKGDLSDIFLGRYQVTDLVGSGAMGSVFRGWDPKLKRPVALKTIHIGSDQVNRDKLLSSLRDEAAISANIHQPNIVTVYDIEDRGGSAFIAMEFVEGSNLRNLLRRKDRLPYTDLIPIGAALARGLATAHEHSLVHHDVKPGNLLLGVDGSVKLTDFGVSLSLNAASRRNDVICGTPGYLAPECLSGQGYTPCSDVWALGVVLWESAAGYNPFRGGSLRQTVARTMTLELESLCDLYPEIPKELSDLVDTLVLKDPALRPSDAGEVANRLEEMRDRLGLSWLPDLGEPVESEPSGATRPKPRSHAATEWMPKSSTGTTDPEASTPASHL